MEWQKMDGKMLLMSEHLKPIDLEDKIRKNL